MSVLLTWEYWQLVLVYMLWGLSRAAALLLVAWIVWRDMRWLCHSWQAMRQTKKGKG